MSGTFAAAAERLAGFATLAWGWTPGEFWNATPAEVGAVLTAMNPNSETPIERDRLECLLERFPDC